VVEDFRFEIRHFQTHLPCRSDLGALGLTRGCGKCSDSGWDPTRLPLRAAQDKHEPRMARSGAESRAAPGHLAPLGSDGPFPGRPMRAQGLH
jgi:hypothetical protein